MGIVVNLEPRNDRQPASIRPVSDEVHAARLLADLEIARARLEMDAIPRKVGDPLAVEIHAIRRALALLDLTLHASLGSRL